MTVEIENTNLIIKSLSGGQVIRTMSESASNDMTKNLTRFYRPRFSLDDSKVYFETDAWATSPAIHELDISTGNTRFISDGYGLIVIPQGEYAGDLIANTHKYFNGGGSYDWYWIIDPKTGEDVSNPVGDSLGFFFDISVCPSEVGLQVD